MRIVHSLTLRIKFLFINIFKLLHHGVLQNKTKVLSYKPHFAHDINHESNNIAEPTNISSHLLAILDITHLKPKSKNKNKFCHSAAMYS